MSVLETPRIYFRGQISWDPIVTNNLDTLYDEESCRTTFPQEPTAKERVAAFRAKAIEEVTGKVWNPHGTHRSAFFDSAISGADLGAGCVQDDAFVGSPASFVGMLVDLEPYGSDTSQLFFDAMSFGIAGGDRIVAPRRTRFTARYLNFARNSEGVIAGVASVIWQTCFSKAEGLAIDVFHSPALRKLKDALDEEGVLGLTVRWNSYRTEYFNRPFKTKEEL
jgi:hypothetical protein